MGNIQSDNYFDIDISILKPLLNRHSLSGTKLVSWFDKYPTTVYTCVNSLGRVNCPSWYHIRIINVNSYSYGSGSDIMDPVCARNNLETLCNNRRWCSSYRNKYTCLYDKRFASISYFCSSKHIYVLCQINVFTCNKKLPNNVCILMTGLKKKHTFQ